MLKLQQRTPGKCSGSDDAREQAAVRTAERVLHGSERSMGPIRGAGGSASSTGRPLDASDRYFMESRFQHDFSRVRVHNGPEAEQSARNLHARAYTIGNDIVFGEGSYAPGSKGGRQLLAHELTHVVQQQASSSPLIQRSITLSDPGGEMPHAPGAMGPFDSKGNTLRGWLHTLCPDGGWTVDLAAGLVSSPERATFCGARPTRGHPHHTTVAHRTSCGCLCDLTAPGSRTVTVQIDQNLTVGGNVTPLGPLGEAATAHVSATDKVSAFTGSEFAGITGAGATQPLAGSGRAQTIPDPPWIIFGHEVCGHARLQSGRMGQTQVGHSTTPGGNATTVDVENRIRREHSTVASSLGIRGGAFRARDGAGNFQSHAGAVYRVSAGETLSGISHRCGVAVGQLRDHIWRSDGSRVTVADQDRISTGEELLIEGIDWHEVISGENMSTIARMWDIPLASLQRANPQITPPDFVLHPGDRLLIPAS